MYDVLIFIIVCTHTHIYTYIIYVCKQHVHVYVFITCMMYIYIYIHIMLQTYYIYILHDIMLHYMQRSLRTPTPRWMTTTGSQGTLHTMRTSLSHAIALATREAGCFYCRRQQAVIRISSILCFFSRGKHHLLSDCLVVQKHIFMSYWPQ